MRRSRFELCNDSLPPRDFESRCLCASKAFQSKFIQISSFRARKVRPEFVRLMRRLRKERVSNFRLSICFFKLLQTRNRNRSSMLEKAEDFGQWWQSMVDIWLSYRKRKRPTASNAIHETSEFAGIKQFHLKLLAVLIGETTLFKRECEELKV